MIRVKTSRKITTIFRSNAYPKNPVNLFLKHTETELEPSPKLSPIISTKEGEVDVRREKIESSSLFDLFCHGTYVRW